MTGHRRGMLSLLAAGAVLAAACGLELGSPPLALSTRDSLVGAGKILRIANTSNEPLTALEIEIVAADGERRSFHHEALGAYETLEVGWKKLGGWQVLPGHRVTIHAEGFLLPYSGRLRDE